MHSAPGRWSAGRAGSGGNGPPARSSLVLLGLVALLALCFPLAAHAQYADFRVDRPAAPDQINTAAVSEQSPDNTQAIRNAINTCDWSGAPCKVFIPTGTYRVAGPNSFIFSYMTDFEFDGGGSTLVFHRESIVNQASGQSPPLFYILGCTRCRFTNFTVDWNWDRWVLASTVSVVNATTNDWTLKFVDYTSINTSTHFAYQVMSQLDPATMSIGLRNGREYYIRDLISSTSQIYPNKAKLGNLAKVSAVNNTNIMKFSFSSPITKVPNIGDLYLLRHLNYEIHGFYGRALQHVSFVGITIRSVPGKCFTIGEDTQFLLFQGIKVVRSPLPSPAPSGATFRPVTSTADGIFIAKTAGYIKILDYEFSYGSLMAEFRARCPAS